MLSNTEAIAVNKQLALIEPINLPDPRRPATMPSLPAWLERCSAAVKLELQPTEGSGKFKEVQTLPAELMPTAEQRRAMQEHVDSLRSYLAETAAESVEAESRIAAVVANLMLVLPMSRKSDSGQEATSEVYLDVLDDVPWWAVKAAARRWHRHDCGKDERGEPYDYRWVPNPGTLRRVAMEETWEVRRRIKHIDRMLQVRQYVDCTQQFEDAKAAIIGLNLALKDGTAANLTFHQAMRRGLLEEIIDA